MNNLLPTAVVVDALDVDNRGDAADVLITFSLPQTEEGIASYRIVVARTASMVDAAAVAGL